MGAGGFVGAIARYGMSGFVSRRFATGYPAAGTLTVNVLGCLLIGALMAAAEQREGLRDETRLLLVTGLLGSFTTFSAFGYETFEMLRESSYRMALGNVVANVVLGLGAVALGRILGTAAAG